MPCYLAVPNECNRWPAVQIPQVSHTARLYRLFGHILNTHMYISKHLRGYFSFRERVSHVPVPFVSVGEGDSGGYGVKN